MHNFECLRTGLVVYPLVRALSKQPELWNEISTRQDYPGSAHLDTESIFLRWCKGLDVEAAFTEIPAFDFPAMGKLPEARELINETLQLAGATELGRVLIVSLRAGGKILPHADEGAYADHYERFHIVLESEEGNIFNCGNESERMRPGELWCFNHKTKHEAWNHSANPRIHLIIDAVAPKYRKERAEVKLAV